LALIFRSKAGADVLMLQADAERLLRALGREPAPQGIVLPEQVEEALANFAVRSEPPASPDDDADAAEDLAPDLARRAWPLLELLRAARARGVPVTWSPA
jgi:hypothetical protein